MYRKLLSLLCVMLFICCRQRDQQDTQSMPPLYAPPVTVELNLAGGFTLNAATGDSIPILINGLGDTIRSGISFPVMGITLSSDSLPAPKRVTAGDPDEAEVHTNVVDIPFEVITKEAGEITQAAVMAQVNAASFYLVNSTGDSLPTNQPLEMQGKSMPCVRYPAKPVEKLQMKDQAISDIRFLDVEQGHSGSSSLSMLHDSKNNIWIGSDGGALCRYDGTSLTTYRIYGGEYVRFLYEDTKQRIWYGGPDGLVCYDGNTFRSFTEQQGLPANWVTGILQDDDGVYWISTFGGGLARYEESAGDTSGTVTLITVREGLPSNTINSLMKDRSGRLWISTRNAGVCYLDLQAYKDTRQCIFGYLDQQAGLSINNALSTLEDRYGNYWIATMNGLNHYELPANGKKGRVTIFTKESGLPVDITNSLHEDEDGNIWCGTYKGMVVLQRTHAGSGFEGARFVRLSEAEGLSHGDVMQIIQDSSGNIWCGTNGGGINCIAKGSFSYLSQKDGLPESKITAMSEGTDGSLWIAPMGYLVRYVSPNPWTRGRLYIYGEKQGLSKMLIREILEDKHGNIWLGTNNGLVLFELPSGSKKGRFTKFTTHEGLTHDVIRTLVEDQHGRIWIGTNGGGVNCLTMHANTEKPSYTITRYTEREGLPSNFIKGITEDQHGVLWFATRAGIVRCEAPTEEGQGRFFIYTEKEGLPDNYTTGFYLDEEDPNRIWLSTDKGVCAFEKTKDNYLETVTYYSHEQGITDNWTWSIFGRPRSQKKTNPLWVAAWSGINVLEQGADFTRVFKLDSRDGLKGVYSSIWDQASLKDRHNRIWWGRGKGLEMLDLNEYKISDAIPKPVLHDLQINGTSYDFRNAPDSTKRGIVYDHVAAYENYPENVLLSYNKNHLTFHFSATDWYAPHKIKYSYRIDGLGESWTEGSPETKAEYRNLPPGTHTFKVRAIGESQTWSDPFEYTFTIRPPWWLSWWAYIGYMMIGVTLMGGAHRYRLNRKLEIAEQKRLKELDDFKNKLYTNITHEFRSPLTLIHGPVANALHTGKTLESREVASIYRQSERLQQLISQMLDLQKIEAGKMKVFYKHGDIIQKISATSHMFDSWAREKGIDFQFAADPPELFMDYDDEKLTQILSNLLSNAIKHTGAQGTITLTVSHLQKLNTIYITVKDTGVGISADDLPFIFDRYYQSSRAAAGGTGIGMALTKNLVDLLKGSITVESQPDVGTTFQVSLPVLKQAEYTATASLQVPDPILSESFYHEATHDTEETSASNKPLVLVVEDHDEVRQYVASCLTKDYSIITASDGMDGLKKAFEHIPDLIISDIMMPRKDGYELCATVKSDIQTSHIPVILLTGRGDHPALLSGIEQGADAYVVKPFDPAELQLRVRKLLELRQSLSQHYRQHATTKNIAPAAASSDRENAFLLTIRSFVEEHISDSQFNMEMLCQHLAMSHPQLHRKITALTGESTGKFVRSIRLAKAKDLLLHSDLTVSEIAYETGFSEPGYFTKVFSKEFNVSPSEFRSQK